LAPERWNWFHTLAEGKVSVKSGNLKKGFAPSIFLIEEKPAAEPLFAMHDGALC
jgi:hypothetical protein